MLRFGLGYSRQHRGALSNCKLYVRSHGEWLEQRKVESSSMEQSVVQMVTQITIAVGTVGVCILAIWGNRIRSCIAGPKLEFRLHNPRGDLTWRRNGTSAIYHHLKIENKRDWSPARHVRIFLYLDPEKSAGWLFCRGAIGLSSAVRLAVSSTS